MESPCYNGLVMSSKRDEKMSETSVYYPETAQFEFDKAIGKLNKALARHGVVAEIGDKELQFLQNNVPVYKVDLSIPAVDTGYRLKGTVTFKGGVLSLFGVNGFSLKDFENIRERACSVCGKKHGKRTTMYVFEKDDELVTVGTTCSKNYANFNVSSVYRILGNFFDSYSKEGVGHGPMSDHFLTYKTSDVMKVLALSHSNNPVYEKKVYGYTSGTTGMVQQYLRQEKLPEFDVDAVLKAKVAGSLLKKFFATINDENNFLYTLNKTLFVDGTDQLVEEIPQRGLGRIVFAFYSAMKQQKNELLAKKNKDLTFIGSLGDKIELALQLVETKEFHSNQFSYYGTSSTLAKCLTEDGNHVSFFTASNKVLGTLEENKNGFVKIGGVVKDHKQFGTVPVTTLSRPKVAK